MCIKYKDFPVVEVRISPEALLPLRKLMVLVNKIETRAILSGTTVLISKSLQLNFDSFDQRTFRLVFTQDMLSLYCQFVPFSSEQTNGEMNCRLQAPASSYSNGRIKGLAGNWIEGYPEADLTPPFSQLGVNASDPQSIYIAYNSSIRVTAFDSLFTYGLDADETWESINTPVVPQLDPLPPLHPNTDENLVNAVCAGSPQCTFDARFSGILTAAKSAADFIGQVRADQSQLVPARGFCEHPDIPYATMTVSSHREGGHISVSGCANGAHDTSSGSEFSATCTNGTWNPDWRGQRDRCCLQSVSTLSIINRFLITFPSHNL